MDISDTLAPNSDQLDAVDLLGGPRTFTIWSVSKNDDEQPVNVHLEEFPRVWRPGKSMRRVLAACWGPQTAAWIGRRVTLYCDESVRFGNDVVGGTRISHLSHLDGVKKIPLLASRGRSATYTVRPLADDTPPDAVWPDYLAQARDAKTLDEVKAIWGAASAAGHLTDGLAAELKAIGDALQEPATPDQPALDDDDPRDQS